jgi:hypothetical protein
MGNKYRIILVLFFFAILSCREPYLPEINTIHGESVLVVEGYLNADGDSEYQLSMTNQLYNKDTSDLAVHNANLYVEGENGEIIGESVYMGKGRYVIRHPSLKLDSRYRLGISAQGKIYLSDFVQVIVSPEITDIKWRYDAEKGVEITLSSGEGSSPYFRWEIEETWKFRSRHPSYFLLDNNTLRPRRTEELKNICFKSEKPSRILLYSSAALNKNAVTGHAINSVPKFSEKLGIRYSLLVKQYSISKEAFTYWDLVKNNSENIGDVFGTMPTELKGNIVCVSNPNERVFGYIEAGKVSQKRTYINYDDFEKGWDVINNYYAGCDTELVPAGEALDFFGRNKLYIPLYGVHTNGSMMPTHYEYTSIDCTDCTLRGTLQKPDFWID